MASETVFDAEPTLDAVRTTLRQADMYVQGSTEKIRALVKAIQDALKNPDGADMRKHIKALSDSIDFYAYDTMNTINAEAATVRADYTETDTMAEEIEAVFGKPEDFAPERPYLIDVVRVQRDELWTAVALLEGAQATIETDAGGSAARLVSMALDRVKSVNEAFEPYL
jgi:hypothetical protein